jgi:galactose mutarotase-like enzyme
VEQVYCIHPLHDGKDRTLVALANKAGDRAVSLRFSVKELPYFTLWKNTNSEVDGYVTGLEPGTNFPNNRRIERKFGRVPKLAPGESHRASIDFAIHHGVDSVQGMMKEIAEIQGQIKPVVDSTPEKKD